MPDVLDFAALYPEEDEATIRARWESWANDGLGADDPERWTDVREGTHFWVSTTPMVRECARLYDLAGSEVPASAIPQWSWGGYLDDIAEVQGVERLAATNATGSVTFTAPDGTPVPAGAVVGVEPAEPGADAPTFATTAGGEAAGGVGVTLPIRAEDPGSASNVAAEAITALLSPVAGVTAVLNADPTVGGTDEQADDALRDRVLDRYAGPAAANQRYYRRLALDFEGIGRATVIPVADGPGTFTIIVATADGQPVSSDVVDGFQEQVDPVAGQGIGDGQIGATITVETATTLDIDVAGTVEFEPGYSMDGGGGTVPLRDTIDAALASYIATVASGDEVVRAQVSGRITSIQGVHDLGGLTLNGVAGNVVVPSDPPKVPTLGDTAGLVEGVV